MLPSYRTSSLLIALIALLSSVLITTPVIAQVGVPQLWRARALEAGENLQTLGRKLEPIRDRWNTREANELKCEIMLETAFALHLTHESIAHKVLKNGRHAFKIVLSGGEQGLFDLTYIYDPISWSITSMEILSLPRMWELIYPTEVRSRGGVLLLIKDKADADPRCVLGFSQDMPFFAHVSRSSK
jgi:hypothetical protein